MFGTSYNHELWIDSIEFGLSYDLMKKSFGLWGFGASGSNTYLLDPSLSLYIARAREDGTFFVDVMMRLPTYVWSAV